MRHAVIENKAPAFSIEEAADTATRFSSKLRARVSNVKRRELVRTCGGHGDHALLPLVSGVTIGGRVHTGIVKIEIG